jgi:MFS family permease
MTTQDPLSVSPGATSATSMPLGDPGTDEPRTRRGFIPLLGLANYGVFLALLTPVLVSLALRVRELAGASGQASALSLVVGVPALVALVANPIAGRLSDRTRSRFGMRRPWIIGGAIVGLLGSVFLSVAPNIALLTVGWAIAQLGFNAALAGITATVPDQVPNRRRGVASASIAVGTPIAIVIGSALAAAFTSDLLRFLIPAVLGALFCVVFALALRDRRLGNRAVPRLTFVALLGSFVFNPRRFPDFGWVWLNRFLIFFGYVGIATYLPFYVIARYHVTGAHTASTVLLANLCAVVGMILSAGICGFLSDKLGMRRPFVTVAGVVMVIGLALLATAPAIGFVFLAEAVIGLGFGAFLAVDNALATAVLPAVEDRAKDLGVLNIASALPGAVAPAVAGPIIALGAATGISGYSLWYLVGALVSLAGALLVYRVKGVR